MNAQTVGRERTSNISYYLYTGIREYGSKQLRSDMITGQKNVLERENKKILGARTQIR